jgi:hypothetical protein
VEAVRDGLGETRRRFRDRVGAREADSGEAEGTNLVADRLAERRRIAQKSRSA